MQITNHIYVEGLPSAGSLQTIGTLANLKVSNLWDDTPADVVFNVHVNYKAFVKEYYNIGPLRGHTIDLREILRRSFTFIPPLFYSSSLSSNFKDITLEIIAETETYSVQFFLVNNHFEGEDSRTYLDSKFLTQQPFNKRVSFNDVEFLTVCAVESLVRIFCRVKSKIKSEVILFEEVKGGVQTIPIDFSSLAETIENNFDMPGDVIQSFYLFIEGFDDETKYGQHYMIDTPNPYLPVFYFENFAGGFDMIRPTGDIKDKNKYKPELFKSESTIASHYVDDSGVVNVNTGYLSSKDERIFFKNFFRSTNQYIYERGQLLRVIITEATAESAWFELGNYQFDYRYAIDKPIISSRNGYRQKRGDERNFRLSPDIIVLPLSSDLLSFMFKDDNRNKSFPTAEFYTVRISAEIEKELSLSKPTLETDRVAYALEQANIAPAKQLQGLVCVEDKRTGEEACALIVAPKKELVSFDKSEYFLKAEVGGEISLIFKSIYGGYDMHDNEYTVTIGAPLQPFIYIIPALNKGLDVMVRAVPESRITDEIQLRESATGKIITAILNLTP